MYMKAVLIVPDWRQIRGDTLLRAGRDWGFERCGGGCGDVVAVAVVVFVVCCLQTKSLKASY